MKKFIAAVLMLCVALSAVTAAAETRAFFMSAVQDAEGNLLTFDQLTDMPVLVFSVDDETGVCAFGTEEDLISGTYEITEQSEEGVALTLTLEDGEVLEVVYLAAEDTFVYVDETGYIFFMTNVDLLSAEAAA